MTDVSGPVMAMPVHAARTGAPLVGQRLVGFRCKGPAEHKFMASPLVRRLMVETARCPICGALFTFVGYVVPLPKPDAPVGPFIDPLPPEKGKKSARSS